MWNMLDPPIRKIDKFNSVKDKICKKEQVTPRYFSLGDRKLNILHSVKLRNSCMHAGNAYPSGAPDCTSG